MTLNSGNSLLDFNKNTRCKYFFKQIQIDRLIDKYKKDDMKRVFAGAEEMQTFLNTDESLKIFF